MRRPILQRLMRPVRGVLFASFVLWLLAALVSADEVAPLANSKPLNWQGDLADRMMDGLHRYIERKIDESIAQRPSLWKRDCSSLEAYEKSVAPNRARLKKVLGIVDPPVAARMERFGDDANAALVAKTDRYSVYQVRWPVLEGVSGEGLLLEPAGKPLAQVRWMYDMLGLGDRSEIEFYTGGHCFHCERAFEFLDKHLRGSGN